MKVQKYLAELLGTFTLTLSVYLSLAMGGHLSTPVVAALTLGVGVYTMGAISGAHFNPAISLAMATVGKLKWRDAVLYVVFQLVGAVLAMYVGLWMAGGATGVTGAEGWVIGAGEALGAAMLAVGVAAVTFGKADDDSAGLTVGGSLLVGILMASTVANGVLNPAVALGIGSVSVTYMLAPIVGAVVAAWVYKFLQD